LKTPILELELLRERISTLFTEHPELAEDTEFRSDVIEGQTDTFEILENLSNKIIGEKTLQLGIEARAKDLATRKARSELRESALRKLCLQILDMANLRTARLSEATLSVSPSPPALRIVNAEQIPDQYWRVKREPNISSIRAHLLTGGEVGGCTLANRHDILKILVK